MAGVTKIICSPLSIRLIFIYVVTFIMCASVNALSREEKDKDVLLSLEPQHAEPYNDGFDSDRKKLAKHRGIQCVEPAAHRVFEIGFSFDAIASNNALRLEELLKKRVVISLPDINDRTQNDGLLLNLSLFPQFFINLNLPNGVHVGINTGLEVDGGMSISKELFDFLGKGNSLGEKISFDADMKGDAFYFVGAAVGFDFLDYHLEIKPAVFLPLMHVETQHTNIAFQNDYSGKTTGSMHTDIALYSCFNLETLFEDGFDGNTILNGIKNGWGFDLETSLDHDIIENLVMSIYSRMPIVPGSMGYSMKKSADMFLYMDPLTNGIYDDERGDETDFDFSFDMGDSIYKKSSWKVHRPFKMGVKVAWRPLVNWFTIGGLFGFGVKYPFSSDAKAYVEYSIIANIDVFAGNWNKSIIGLHLSTSYFNEIFSHKAVLGINLRALEIDLGISASSPNFVESFHGGGVGAFLLFAFGW